MAITRERLMAENKRNLEWAHTFSGNRHELWAFGVDIMRCFAYDIIQILNHISLNEILSEESEGSDATNVVSA